MHATAIQDFYITYINEKIFFRLFFQDLLIKNITSLAPLLPTIKLKIRLLTEIFVYEIIYLKTDNDFLVQLTSYF